MARNPKFCQLWDIPEPDSDEINSGYPRQEVIENKYFKDMSDAELVLRFFAYRQLDQWQGNTLEIFLDDFLINGNLHFTDEVLTQLQQVFEDTVMLAYQIFDHKAFWLHGNREDKWFYYERPTKILYDPLMQVLANFLDKADQLLLHKDRILQGLENFHKEENEVFKGRDTNRTKVIERINVLSDYFNSFINE